MKIWQTLPYNIQSCSKRGSKKEICHSRDTTPTTDHVFHRILQPPLNHSLQFMSVLVNPRSRLLASAAEIGMCHYCQCNSHNIYDRGCPIWSLFLSSGPLRVGCLKVVVLLCDICSPPLSVMQHSCKNRVTGFSESSITISYADNSEMPIWYLALQIHIVIMFDH